MCVQYAEDPMRDILEALLNLLFPHKRHRAQVENVALSEFLSHAAPRTIHTADSEVVSVFPYENAIVRDVIWALKYEDSMHAAKLCGESLAEHLLETLSDTTLYGSAPLLIIPIPLSSERRKERGYNQVERIAHCLAEGLHGRGVLDPLLIKTRETAPQTKLSRAERLTNVRDVFALKRSVKDRHCLVVDDVVTTGSTLSEARRVLAASGAASVLCCAVASAGE